MGRFNCCCTVECYELQPSDLPTVTISGWTSEGWSGTACCKCNRLTPDVTPDWTEQCSGEFGIAKIDIDCTWDERAIILPPPKVTTVLTCPVPSNWCCEGPVVQIGTGESSTKLWYRYKFILAYRAKYIEVCISKQDVDCGGVVETKYVLKSRFCFETQVVITRGSEYHQWRDTTITDSCFEPSGFGDPFPFCDSGSKTDTVRIAPCTLADVGDEDVLISSGDLCFERVKFLDDPPDGVLTFNNDDDGDGCTWDLCDTTFEYETEVCFTVSGWPPGIKPCWCDYDWTISSTTTTTDLLGLCGCQTCPSLGCGTGYSQIIDTDECLLTPQCCPGNCNCNEVCYSYDTVCYSKTWVADPEVCAEPFGDSAECFLCWSMCDCVTFPCHKPKASTGSSDPCYWNVVCGFSTPKYRSISSTGTSATWSTECEFIGPQSLCISAPTWTLLFT
jgi:hypothetical protein